MATLIDTSLWIDFTRARSPQALKEFIAPYILHPDAHLAGPVTFEVLRHATPKESEQLVRQFQTFPVLATPPDLWVAATALGQACRQQGLNVGALDLLLAAIAAHHGATVVTFDGNFQRIAAVSDLRVELLQRPQR